MIKTKKIYWFLFTVALIGSFLILFFKTDYLQNAGLKIPRNFEECLKYGGKNTFYTPPGGGIGTWSECKYMGLKFESFSNF